MLFIKLRFALIIYSIKEKEMSKCNLLRPLSYSVGGSNNAGYEGGTFYLFSQYADDLTRQNAQGDAYRVVPSKFGAFNINYHGKTDSGIGQLFQNTYEHSCAAHRSQMSNDTDASSFTPNEAADLFWITMKSLDSSLEAVTATDNTDFPPMSSLMWVGESDVCGTTVIDGDAYSEIYCFVPGSARPRSYHVSMNNYSTPRTIDGTFDYPFGWTSSTYPTNTGIPHTDIGNLTIASTRIPTVFLPGEDPVPGDLMESHAAAFDENTENVPYDEIPDWPSNWFEINTIVLFYDVVAKDQHGDYRYIYTNIPMGIYFTGPIDPESSGQQTQSLMNSVKKYISHDDIYGQGTSYGLRITTKFTAAPSVSMDTANPSSPNVTVVWAGHTVSEAAAIIDSMRSAADAVLDSIAQNSARSAELADHLAQFRNKSTNIPYIRRVNNEPYWFVNGRNTGTKVNQVDIDLDEIREQIIADLESTVQSELAQYESQIEDFLNKPYIEYISPSKYFGDADIQYIPQREDYQDLSGTTCVDMFRGCSSLTRIPRLEISNSLSMSGMFYGCSSLTSVDLTGSWNCSNFDEAFYGCSLLQSVKIDAMSAISFTNTFSGCSQLSLIIADGLKPKQNISSPLVIDLSQTNVSAYSVRRMIENSQDSEIDFVNGEPKGFIRIILPSSFIVTPGIENSIQLAIANKGVMFELVNQ